MQETWQQELRFQSYNMVQKDTMRIATVYGSSLSARYALGTAVAETDDVSSWHELACVVPNGLRQLYWGSADVT
jgi:hypothetical protein